MTKVFVGVGAEPQGAEGVFELVELPVKPGTRTRSKKERWQAQAARMAASNSLHAVLLLFKKCHTELTVTPSAGVDGLAGLR